MQTTKNQDMAGTKVTTSKVQKSPVFLDLARFAAKLIPAHQECIRLVHGNWVVAESRRSGTSALDLESYSYTGRQTKE